MSVGLTSINDILLQAVNTTVLNFSIPIIAAAGNDGSDSCNNSPARSPYVVPVGAIDINDQRTSFSNFLSIRGCYFGAKSPFTISDMQS